MPVLLIAVALVGAFVFTGKKTDVVVVPHDTRLIQVGCSLFDSKANLVRRVPGNRCVFLNDGTFLMGYTAGLIFYDRTSAGKWNLPMHTHHIITQTSAGDILVGSSELKKLKGHTVRFDVLHRVNTSGKILSSFKIYDHRKELEPVSLKTLGKFNWDPDSGFSADFEFTHMNSYYEIQENASAAVIPAFKTGNVIVNCIGPGRIMILSPDLQKILWQLDQRTISGSPNYHDVQVLPNGNLLMYENVESGQQNSSLLEYNPVAKKIEWRYRTDPPSAFFAPATGGVQLLPDGTLLYSLPKEANFAIRIDRNGKTLETFRFPPVTDSTGKNIGIQDAKFVDLSGFLKNNQPL